MASLVALFAVVVACVAQGARSHQHLVFFAPQGWDKVELLEYKIDRHDAAGYNPHGEGWVTAATSSDMTTFAYQLTVRAHDTVSVRVTTVGGDPPIEDSLRIDDVRTQGNQGTTNSWKVGPLPLFSLLENVRHADVWKTFFSKVRELPTGDVQGQMGRVFADAEQDHEGWHLVMLMDHVPYSNVELSYTTTARKTRRTSKTVDGGGVFAAWSVDDVAGDLELSFDGESKGKVNMQIQTASFEKSSFAVPGGECHVYILPFKSHKQSDAAWREVMKYHTSDAHQFWDHNTASWKGENLQQLTEDVTAGKVTAALPAETPAALDQHDDVAPDPVPSSWSIKIVILVAGVALMLFAGSYYYCCATPEEDKRGCSIDSATVSNDPRQAPSMLGDAWPQESVLELAPPAAAV